MANRPTAYLTTAYPKSQPVTRYPSPGGRVPNVIPAPGPFTTMKAGLPNLPEITELYHTPRPPGRNGV